MVDRHVEVIGDGDRSRIVVETTDTHALTSTADRATVRNLTIRTVGARGAKCGVVLVSRGRVLIDPCDLKSSNRAVVYISGMDSDPLVSDCQIRDGQDAGVDVYEQGQGTIERCVFSGNARAGVEISEGGNPTVRDCEIRRNGYEGVWVSEQGQGTFTGNTLTGNARGAWDVASDAGRVTRTGNRPNA